MAGPQDAGGVRVRQSGLRLPVDQLLFLALFRTESLRAFRTTHRRLLRPRWTPKVALAVHGSEPSELGLGGLQTVEDALQRFRAALAERELPFEEPLLGLYRHAEYAVQKLREYFQNRRAGLDREMAEILADHLDATVGRVIGIAKEIDDEYASPGDAALPAVRLDEMHDAAEDLNPHLDQADAQRPGRQTTDKP